MKLVTKTKEEIPVGTLIGAETLTLRSPKVMATNIDLGKSSKVRFRNTFVQMEPDGYLYFPQVDLSHLTGAEIQYRSKKGSGTLELHLGAPDGPLVATWNLDAKQNLKKPLRQTLQAKELMISTLSPNKEQPLIRIMQVYFR